MRLKLRDGLTISGPCERRRWPLSRRRERQINSGGDGNLIPVRYRRTDGVLITAGSILRPALKVIPYRAREITFCGICIRLEWRAEQVTGLFAPDKTSAAQIVTFVASQVAALAEKPDE